MKIPAARAAMQHRSRSRPQQTMKTEILRFFLIVRKIRRKNLRLTAKIHRKRTHIAQMMLSSKIHSMAIHTAGSSRATSSRKPQPVHSRTNRRGTHTAGNTRIHRVGIHTAGSTKTRREAQLIKAPASRIRITTSSTIRMLRRRGSSLTEIITASPCSSRRTIK